MIETAERMHVAMHKPARAADPGMGEGGGRSEKDCKKRRLKKPLHRISLPVGANRACIE
jgi:hypothetical protein